MNRVTLVLGAILMTVSAGLVGQAYGYANGLERGKLEAAAKHDRDLVTQLSSAIKAGADLAKTANAASQTLRKSVSKFQSQYQPVIKEFNDALSETADGRAGCVFSPSVMQ
ncbi:MAG: hypothetical protein RSD82_08870, partial [Comamonas sp.]